MNTFYFECNNEVASNIILDDVDFSKVHNMSFDDLMNYNEIDFFVNCMVKTADDIFNNIDNGVFITLADDEGEFIWSIDIEFDEGSILYSLINWLDVDGRYCYEKD